MCTVWRVDKYKITFKLVRGRGGFQCDEDVYPNSHVQRTIEILQLTFFLAILV